LRLGDDVVSVGNPYLAAAVRAGERVHVAHHI
jgi:hypothetical protein